MSSSRSPTRRPANTASLSTSRAWAAFPSSRDLRLGVAWRCLGSAAAARRNRLASRKASPAELLHRPSGIPDLRHVADLVAFELHHIDVVRLHLLAGRRAGAARAA